MPLDIERAWQIDENVVCYWAYWTPFGDECIVMRLYKNGILSGGDSDWQAFLKLLKLNPILEDYNLGSSDCEAKHVLFVDKLTNKYYIVSSYINNLVAVDIFQLLKDLHVKEAH